MANASLKRIMQVSWRRCTISCLRAFEQNTNVSCEDQRYYQFGEEIKGFAGALQQLDLVFKNIKEQRQQRPYLGGNAARRDSTLQRLPQSLIPLPALTGDFMKTINACEKLLYDNSKFRWNSAGFVDNVRWWLGVEDDVAALKDRIRFHTIKVRKVFQYRRQKISDLIF